MSTSRSFGSKCYDFNYFDEAESRQIKLLIPNKSHEKGAKVVLKDPLKYIPVIGWAWSFCEYIFVKRVWEKDQQSLVRDLNSILEYPDDLKYAV